MRRAPTKRARWAVGVEPLTAARLRERAGPLLDFDSRARIGAYVPLGYVTSARVAERLAARWTLYAWSPECVATFDALAARDADRG
jgi:hypothetical protein